MDKTEIVERKRGLFPAYSLRDALKIAESIKKNNNLHPYNRLDLAASLDYSPNSSNFRLLIISSNNYGLTMGSYIAEKIELTDLGKSIVAPTSDIEKNTSLRDALFNAPLFKKIFTKFDQGQLPRKELLINSLNREEKIPLPKCEDAYNVILKNARELGILKNVKGTDYIRMDLLTVSPLSEQQDAEKELPDEVQVEGQDERKLENENVNMTDEKNKKDSQFKPKVFLSHSKNNKIVSQIKQILEFGQFEYVIAEETETTAKPISEKVFGLMKQCNCAIINLSVDKPDEQNIILNQNVLIEIGAAFLQYNKKVILLVDKRIVDKLPSNLHGLYRSEYSGDELSFETAMKLQNSLKEFRKE